MRLIRIILDNWVLIGGLLLIALTLHANIAESRGSNSHQGYFGYVGDLNLNPAQETYCHCCKEDTP